MPCNEEYFIASQGRYGLSGDTTPSNGAFYIRSWDFDPYTITDNNHLILRRNAKNSETSPVIPSGLNFFIEGDEDFVDDFNSSVISCIAVDEEQLELLSGKFTVQEYDAITVGLTLNTVSVCSPTRGSARRSRAWSTAKSSPREAPTPRRTR